MASFIRTFVLFVFLQILFFGVTLLIAAATLRSLDAALPFTLEAVLFDWLFGGGPYEGLALPGALQGAFVAFWRASPVIDLARPLGLGTQAVLGLLLLRTAIRAGMDYCQRQSREPALSLGVYLKAERHRWYQRPAGLIGIGLLVAVTGNAINYFLGLI